MPKIISGGAASSGYSPGGTDVAIADGGTGASTAAEALANLGAAPAIPMGRARYSGTSQYSIPGVIHTSGVNTFTATSARAAYFPFFVDEDIVIDQIVFELTTGVAASTSRAAIYNADTNWQPTSLVTNADTGAKNTTAAEVGVIATTLAADVTLAAGRYLFWLNASTGNPVFRSWRCYCGHLLGYPVGLGSNGAFNQIYVAQSYGAPPSTGDAWTSVATSTTAMDYPILVRVKTP